MGRKRKPESTPALVGKLKNMPNKINILNSFYTLINVAENYRDYLEDRINVSNIGDIKALDSLIIDSKKQYSKLEKLLKNEN